MTGDQAVPCRHDNSACRYIRPVEIRQARSNTRTLHPAELADILRSCIRLDNPFNQIANAAALPSFAGEEQEEFRGVIQRGGPACVFISVGAARQDIDRRRVVRVP